MYYLLEITPDLLPKFFSAKMQNDDIQDIVYALVRIAESARERKEHLTSFRLRDMAEKINRKVYKIAGKQVRNQIKERKQVPSTRKRKTRTSRVKPSDDEGKEEEEEEENDDEHKLLKDDPDYYPNR